VADAEKKIQAIRHQYVYHQSEPMKVTQDLENEAKFLEKHFLLRYRDTVIKVRREELLLILAPAPATIDKCHQYTPSNNDRNPRSTNSSTSATPRTQ